MADSTPVPAAVSTAHGRVEVEPQDDGVVVRLAGDVDLLLAPHVREVVRAVEGARVQEIDVTDVTFVDSAGMALLIQVWVAGGRRRVPLRGAGDQVLELVAMMSLGELFDVWDGPRGGHATA
ncbi:STAS domain-containing protein [Cellulomonas marina]|nr:STAS domain-containing protein [Cellulomonas marina]